MGFIMLARDGPFIMSGCRYVPMDVTKIVRTETFHTVIATLGFGFPNVTSSNRSGV